MDNLPCIRAEQFVITVITPVGRYKIIQIIFYKKDGSIFINFPYFKNSQGIVSLVTFPKDSTQPGNVSLEPGGRVTSHLVKYSHHPDGRVHFSQDGKIKSEIMKTALSLDRDVGHVFTVQIQNLSGFESYLKTKDKKHYINFNFPNGEPEAIKFVGHWYSDQYFLKNPKNDIRGPTPCLIDPHGNKRQGVLIATLRERRFDNFVLTLTIEPVKHLTDEPGSHLTFAGGFDSHQVVSDYKKDTQFLALIYPVNNKEELEIKIGSIDFNGNRRKS